MLKNMSIKAKLLSTVIGVIIIISLTIEINAIFSIKKEELSFFFYSLILSRVAVTTYSTPSRSYVTTIFSFISYLYNKYLK